MPRWEATSRRAAYREPNPCGRLSREQGGRSRELAAYSRDQRGQRGLTDGRWVYRIRTYKQTYPGTICAVHAWPIPPSCRTFVIWPEYPICSQIDRLSNVEPSIRQGRPCPSVPMTRWQAPRDDYSAREASRSKHLSFSCRQSREDSLAGVSLTADLGVPSRPAWAGPGQARPALVRSGRTNLPGPARRPQRNMRPQPQPQLSRATHPRRAKEADEVVLRDSGHAGIGTSSRDW